MRRSTLLLCQALLLLSPLAAINASEAPKPSTHCRFVPERADDFAWENDLIAFRVYGPALHKGNENSGIDCWAKRVPTPIIDKWYRQHFEDKLSYHKDHGEGADFYHVGKSRGCGGTAIWNEGKMILSNVYKDWKIISQTPEKTVFQLNYEYELGGGRIIKEEKTISIELGQRLFRSESRFTENGQPADLQIAVGLTTQNQKGAVSTHQEKGWMAVWQDYKNNGQFGTAILVPPTRVLQMEEIKSDQPDESHAVILCNTDSEGRTVHYAGYGWSKAGIETADQWAEYLNQATPTP